MHTRLPITDNRPYLKGAMITESIHDQSLQMICARAGFRSWISLRENAYSTILKILPSKNENFQIYISDIFHISAQNIDCGYSLEPHCRGGSNEYQQSMFLGRNKKNNVYPW